MCLSIPAKILSIDGNTAIVSIGGMESKAALQLLDDVKPGEYVLLHTGFAIQKISEEDALETMQLLNEILKAEEGQDEIH